MGESVSELPAWVRDRLPAGSVGRGARRVLELLDRQPQLASYASTAEIARQAQVNEATVVRTAQLLGLSGWPALRSEVRSRYLASLSAGQVLTEHLPQSPSPAANAIRQDAHNLDALARGVDVDDLAAVAERLATRRRTLVIGSGSFAAPGLQLAHLGQTMGFDIRLQTGGATSLLNEVSLLGADDALVVLSFWWVPRLVVAAARIASDNGGTVVLVSDRRFSPLTSLAHHNVVVPSEGASLFPSLTAAMTVVHAVLAAMVSQHEATVRSVVERNEAIWHQYDLFDFTG